MESSFAAEDTKPLLKSEVVAQIIECLKPSIQALLKMNGREYLHVIVVSPHDTTKRLFDGQVGKDNPDPGRYQKIAELKSALSVRTGMNSAEVILKAPHLMKQGDVVYQGGINWKGLVVAASGAQGALDEAVAYMVAVNLSAYCQMAVNGQQAEAAKGGSYTL